MSVMENVKTPHVKFTNSRQVEIEYKARAEALIEDFGNKRHEVQLAAAREVGPAAAARDKRNNAACKERDKLLSQLKNEEIQAQKRARQQVAADFAARRQAVVDACERERGEAQAAMNAVLKEIEPKLNEQITEFVTAHKTAMEALAAWFETTAAPLRAAEAKAAQEAKAAAEADQQAQAGAEANASSIAAKVTAPEASAPAASAAP